MDNGIPHTRFIPLGKETFRATVRAALLRIFNADIRRHYYVKDWGPMADEFVLCLERNFKSLMDQTAEPGHVRFGILERTPTVVTVDVESLTDGQWRGNGSLNFTPEEWARFQSSNAVVEFTGKAEEE